MDIRLGNTQTGEVKIGRIYESSVAVNSAKYHKVLQRDQLLLNSGRTTLSSSFCYLRGKPHLYTNLEGYPGVRRDDVIEEVDLHFAGDHPCC